MSDWIVRKNDRWESVANCNVIVAEWLASRSINLDKGARGTINDTSNDFLGLAATRPRHENVKCYEIWPRRSIHIMGTNLHSWLSSWSRTSFAVSQISGEQAPRLIYGALFRLDVYDAWRQSQDFLLINVGDLFDLFLLEASRYREGYNIARILTGQCENGGFR